MYALTRTDESTEELSPLPKRKRNSHSKNQFHEIEKIRGHLKRISGVDISLVDGMGVSLNAELRKYGCRRHFSQKKPASSGRTDL